MTDGTLEIRTARLDELAALNALMELAIAALLKPFLKQVPSLTSWVSSPMRVLYMR